MKRKRNKKKKKKRKGEIQYRHCKNKGKSGNVVGKSPPARSLGIPFGGGISINSNYPIYLRDSDTAHGPLFHLSELLHSDKWAPEGRLLLAVPRKKKP